jgi:hypothetical protein
LVDTLEEGRLRHILGRGYGQGLAIQQAVVTETELGPSSLDVAICARALSAAYRVLAIDDPLPANPRNIKLWEWESRALGLEHFAEFIRVELSRAEGKTTNYVSARAYYNAAILTRAALGIHVRLTPSSTRYTTPGGRRDYSRKNRQTHRSASVGRLSPNDGKASKNDRRRRELRIKHNLSTYFLIMAQRIRVSEVRRISQAQPAARLQEPRPDSPGNPVALNRKLELAIKRKARPGDPAKAPFKSAKAVRGLYRPISRTPRRTLRRCLRRWIWISPTPAPEHTPHNPVAPSTTYSAPNNPFPQATNADFTSGVETSAVPESTGTASCSSRGPSNSAAVAAAAPPQTSVIPCQTNPGGNGGRAGINSLPPFGWNENSWAPQYQQYSGPNNSDWSNYYYNLANIPTAGTVDE